MIPRGYNYKSASQTSETSPPSEKEHRQRGVNKTAPEEQEQGHVGGSPAEHPLAGKVAKSVKTSFATSKPPDTVQLEKRRQDKPPIQVPCRYFNAGYCARGDACIYKHDLQRLRLQKVQLKTVLKSSEEEEEAQLQETSQGEDPLLRKEYLFPGRSKEAMAVWRAEYWERKTAEARAHQAQIAREAEKRPSEKTKVQQDVIRLQNKNDPIGSSARKVEGAKDMRRAVYVKGDTEDHGVPIPTEGECCPICHDEPRAIKIFGIMSHCNHVFCYDCIVGWRGAGTGNKTCPICRVKSTFIVKSSVYPYTPSGKVDDDDSVSTECPNEANKPVIERSRSPSSKEVSSETQAEDKDGTENKSSTLGAVNGVGGIVLSPDGESPDSEGEHTGKGNLANELNNSDDSHPGDQIHRSVKNSGSGSLNMRPPNGEPIKRKRTRKKPTGSTTDSNPAKTVLLNNYLKKMKTIPCKYFCDPKHAKTVHLGRGRDESCSSLWAARENGDIEAGEIPTNQRKIPFCKFGNKCHYSHPHPERPHEEYKYTDWEKRELGILKRRTAEYNLDFSGSILDDLELERLVITWDP